MTSKTILSPYICLTEKPIDWPSLLENFQKPEAGALALFCGTVRNHFEGKKVSHLFYEAYLPMAEKTLSKIAFSIWDSYHPYGLIAIHRLGRIDLGETSLFIALSCAHRREAFLACEKMVDQIKANVPIWKKEYFLDQTPARWVNCCTKEQEKRPLNL